jgi:Asp/Glu/hydantoin racemase
MTTATAPLRIANVLPPSFRHVYTVPPEAVGSGFASEVVDLAGEVSFVNELDRTIAGMHFVEAGIRAEAAGYAAVFLNTVGDYGIRELRAAVGIPVVGAGQATCQIAAGLADRFGVLTVWPEATRSMYRRLLEDYGYTDRCVGVRHVMDNDELASAAEDDGFISEMSSLRERALSRLVTGALELLDRGADAIALGCSCMAPARAELQNRLGVPVVDPILAGHKTAEMLVTMGLTHRQVPIPSGFARSVPAMLTGASSETREVDICGDSCSVLSSQGAVV